MVSSYTMEMFDWWVGDTSKAKAMHVQSSVNGFTCTKSNGDECLNKSTVLGWIYIRFKKDVFHGPNHTVLELHVHLVE